MEPDRKKATILHMTTSLTKGGTERQIELIVRKMSSFDHVVVCLQAWGSTGDQLRELGTPVYFVPSRHLFSLAAIRECGHIIDRHSPDLMMTYLPFADLFGRLWRRRWRVPRVACFLRSTMRECRYFPLVILEILTQRWADFFFAVSGTVKNFYEGWGLLWRSVTVMPNGIELEELEAARDSGPILPNFSPDTPIIGYVARLRKERGHRTLFRSMRVLKRADVRVHLCLIGDGPHRTTLEDLVRKLDIADRVTFLGEYERKDVFRILRDLSIYVHPSEYEGMSNALLEAMAAGLPIIATDIPENRELLIGGASGILVPTRDAHALAQALLDLVRDQKKCMRLGNSAKQSVLAFDSRSTIRQLEHHLSEVISSRH